MPQKTYYIKGMHCPSCEILIEKELLAMDGIEFTDVSLSTGRLDIKYSQNAPSIDRLNKLFKENNYFFSDSPFTKQNFSWGPMVITIIVAVAIIILFLIGSRLGLSSFINVNSDSSVFAFFVFGLIAGISSCAALVGGLILSLSKKWSTAYSESDSIMEKAKPNLLFNAGRLISYWLFGLILGLIGQKLNISPTITSLIIIVVSIIMVVLALQMLGVKSLSRLRFALPKKVTGQIAKGGDSTAKLAPFVIGFLTFLLPCGFTIIAEGMAILSGDPLRGSMIMLFFALGTAIPLMAIGTFSTKLVQNTKISGGFLKVAGILVIFFVLFNLNTQFGFTAKIASAQPVPNNAPSSDLSDQVQNIKTVFTLANDINPSTFTIQVGRPVRFEVDPEDNGSGCMSTIMIPGLYNRAILLQKGQPIVMEFTPTKTGTYQITCAMGVPRGKIIVN